LPVPTADVTKVFFYVKRTLAADSYLLQLTSADSTKIAWLSATTGQVRIKLGANTAGLAGAPFSEIRLLMADGRYITADEGKINILESVVDQAV
jgi:hypothetical protein